MLQDHISRKPKDLPLFHTQSKLVSHPAADRVGKPSTWKEHIRNFLQHCCPNINTNNAIYFT